MSFKDLLKVARSQCWGFETRPAACAVRQIFKGGVREWHICPNHPWQWDTRAVGKVTQNGWSSVVVSISSQGWDDVSVGKPMDGACITLVFVEDEGWFREV